MEKLQQEIAKKLFITSNDMLVDYYGISPDPFEIEFKLIYYNKATWSPKGWEFPTFLMLEKVGLEHLFSIASLKGSAHLKDNNLKSLKGFEGKKIRGDFVCDNNPNLKSLKGSPDTVVLRFSCVNCGLSSLEGGPRVVGGVYDCRQNKLESLQGHPERLDTHMRLDSTVDRKVWWRYRHDVRIVVD